MTLYDGDHLAYNTVVDVNGLWVSEVAEKMPARFAARWSRLVWIVTLAVTVVVVLITGGMIWTAVAAPRGVQWLLIASAVVVLSALCITVLFAPLAYGVLDTGILIHRAAGLVVIRYEQISEIRRIQSREIGSSVRVFGSGGFFGWFGRFYGRRIGWFRAYCSSQADLVLITRTDGGKIVISPYPADAFLDAVRMARRDTA